MRLKEPMLCYENRAMTQQAQYQIDQFIHSYFQ